MEIGDVFRALGDTVEDNFYPEKFADRIIKKRLQATYVSLRISYGMIMLIIVCVIGVTAMLIWLTSGSVLIGTWEHMDFMPTGPGVLEPMP
jgi:hypothetical protein